MHTTGLAAASCFILVFGFVGCSGGSSEPADTVYTNGRIYTVNEAQPWAEAVAIKDRRFVAVGSAGDMEAHQSDGTEVIDLAGAFAMPGIVDPHTHPIEVVHEELFDLVLTDNSSPEVMVNALKAYADANPDKEWIIASTWPFGTFADENPKREMLDAAISDRPVFFIDQGGHSAWLNTRALEVTGLWTARDEDLPKGANVVRDASGIPTGTIRENAMAFAKRSMPRAPHDELVEAVREIIKRFNALGITTTKAAAGNQSHARAVDAVAQAGGLTLRFHLSMNLNHFAFPETSEEYLRDIKEADKYVSEFVDPLHVKIYLDGAPLSREAWLIEPYPGTSTTGLATYQPEELRDLLIQYTDQNRRVMMHAIGDRAVREALNAIEAVKAARPESPLVHHITHNNMISDDDLIRFEKLGLTIEFSPLGGNPKSAVDNLASIMGPDVMARFANPRRALDAGLNVAVASDWTVSPLSPMHRIGMLVTRIHADLPDEPPFLPNAAITAEEAIRASTLAGALVMDIDSETGSIEVGKFADMIVIDRDITAVPADQIQGAVVTRTVFAGEAVYVAP